METKGIAKFCSKEFCFFDSVLQLAKKVHVLKILQITRQHLKKKTYTTQLCSNSSVYKKVIISGFAVSFPFPGPHLGGQSFVIFAKNFQASIFFLALQFSGVLLYICYFYSSWCIYYCFHLAKSYLGRVTKTTATLSDLMEGRRDFWMFSKFLWCLALSLLQLS